MGCCLSRPSGQDPPYHESAIPTSHATNQSASESPADPEQISPPTQPSYHSRRGLSQVSTASPGIIRPLGSSQMPDCSGERGKCFSYTRLFDNNRRLGCLVVMESDKRSEVLDEVDNQLQTIPDDISVRVVIWRLSTNPTPIRDQTLSLTADDKERLRRRWYRRFDVAFHPSCDRVALFNSVYFINSDCSSVQFDIFNQRGLFSQLTRDGSTKNAWNISFSPDGEYVAFAFTSSTRAPGLSGRAGYITNAIVLFPLNRPWDPLRTIVSTIGGNSLSMGGCSVTFHPSELALFWTSVFVFTNRRNQCATKLWYYGAGGNLDHLITKTKYDDFEFSPCGTYMYSHPPRNGQCGFRDRFDLVDILRSNASFGGGHQLGHGSNTELIAQPVKRVVGDDISLSGRSPTDVVGIILQDNGEGGVDIFRKTILSLPSSVPSSHVCTRLVVRARDQRTTGFYLVLFYPEDGRELDIGSAENDAKPLIMPVTAEELMRHETTTTKINEIRGIFPVATQDID